MGALQIAHWAVCFGRGAARFRPGYGADFVPLKLSFSMRRVRKGAMVKAQSGFATPRP